MNIIIPEDEKIEYFVLDLRDALEGTEMGYIKELGTIPENVLIIPKKYLKMKGKRVDIASIELYFKDTAKNLKYLNNKDFFFTKAINFDNSRKLGVKIIRVKDGIDSVLVGAPLWNSSVQIIEVLFKYEIVGDGKFIDVVNAGIMPIGMANAKLKNYYDGVGVGETKLNSTEHQEQSMEL